LKGSKLRSQIDTLEAPVPTTCCFLNSDLNTLVAGYNDGYVSVIDINKNAFTSNIKTFKPDGKETLNRANIQPNTLACSTSIPVIYGGFEDSTIKSFDFRSSGSYE
jgi:hypothetical protein